MTTPARPTILLFDIDGTLITTGGVGQRALAQAFGALHGRPDAAAFRLDGMTDPAIVAQGLGAIGVSATAEAVEAVLSLYLERLQEEVARAPATSYRLHPGMEEAVERALGMPRMAVGLGTGNIREGARIKLNRVELFHRFAFGGFGCDHADRTELIRKGAERGAEWLGTDVAECRIVVIGDTPRDVAAAQGIGAECLAVATGSFPVEELRASGADAAFENLEVPGALEALLEGP